MTRSELRKDLKEYRRLITSWDPRYTNCPLDADQLMFLLGLAEGLHRFATHSPADKCDGGTIHSNYFYHLKRAKFLCGIGPDPDADVIS